VRTRAGIEAVLQVQKLMHRLAG